MIKLIATIDTYRGMSCLWKLPSIENYQSKIAAKGRLKPLDGILNDIPQNDTAYPHNTVIWAKNGLKVQKELLEYIDELYITQVNGQFECEETFPAFENDFVMVAKGKIKQDNGILFQHQVWRAKRLGKFPTN